MEEKTNVSGIVRDLKTGALLNTNEAALTSYRKRKEEHRLIQRMATQIATLEEKVSRMQDLLDQLINKA